MASIVGGDKGKSLLVRVLEQVKDFLTEEVLFEDITDKRKKKELDKRSAACAVCLENWEKLLHDLNRINRPDVKMALDPEGKDIKEYFSEVRQKEMKTLTERIEKHSRALEKAMKGDMKDVYDLNQQSSSKDKGGGGGKSPEGTAESSA